MGKWNFLENKATCKLCVKSFDIFTMEEAACSRSKALYQKCNYITTSCLSDVRSLENTFIAPSRSCSGSILWKHFTQNGHNRIMTWSKNEKYDSYMGTNKCVFHSTHKHQLICTSVKLFYKCTQQNMNKHYLFNIESWHRSG